MDSLLANYASSDDEDDTPERSADPPSNKPSSLSLPPPKPSPSPISSSLTKPRLFSSLPPPKSHLHAADAAAAADEDEGIPPRPTKNPPSSAPSTIFSSIPPPKSSSSSSSSFFSSLPAPKSSSSSSSFFSFLPAPKSTDPAPIDRKPKKIVQFRPPIPASLLKPSDFDKDDDVDARERKRAKEAPPSSTKNPPSSAPSTIFSSIPPPKSSSSLSPSFFSSLPAPKSTDPAPADLKPKKIVQFRPPIPASLLKPSDFDKEDDVDARERKRAKEAPPSSAPNTISSFLPAPKNSLCLAPSLGSVAARRSVLQDVPAVSSVEAIKPELESEAIKLEQETVVHENYENYGSYDGSWAGAPGVDRVDVAGYAAYAHGGEFYGTADAPEYAGYVGGVEASGWIPSYGGVEVERTAPEVPDVGRIMGRRGRSEIPAEIIEVKQDELMKNRPREDQSKMTGIAFGPSYQPVSSSGKGKPSKLQKRKHQIGALYFDMRQKEMELAERRSRGLLTKAETQAKYGW